jgi:hypothetical protein
VQPCVARLLPDVQEAAHVFRSWRETRFWIESISVEIKSVFGEMPRGITTYAHAQA